MARAHAQNDPNLIRLHYHCQTVEEHEATLVGEMGDDTPLREEGDDKTSLLYDGVVCSEVIEHVSDPELFVETCCRLDKVRDICSLKAVTTLVTQKKL